METLLRGFDPSKICCSTRFEEIEFPMDANGKANIKNKKENNIEINCKSKTGGLLVLSEIYYEPGWKAFVNGKETKFIKQTTYYDRFRYRQEILSRL